MNLFNGTLKFLFFLINFKTAIGSDSDFGPQIWQHPTSSDYFVEVRVVNICSGQPLLSGYFHSKPDDVALFFIYAQATKNPDTAPLAIWTHGGPGASTLVMAFSGATGCILSQTHSGLKVSYKPVTRKKWNEDVNVVFIEQPIGTGFSHGTGPSGQNSTVGAAIIYEFIQILLKQYPGIKELSLHSLSYGGHFIPEWASKIVAENKLSTSGKSSNQIIPLKSLTIGNPWFGVDEQYLKRYETLCDTRPYIGASPISLLLPPSTCKTVSKQRDTCQSLLKKCRETSDLGQCAAADQWCTTSVQYFLSQTGRNAFDLSVISDDPNAIDTYPLLAKFLSSPAVQNELGVLTADNPIPTPWSFYNPLVSILYGLEGDIVKRTDKMLVPVLAAGVDILIYEGTLDWVCGYLGLREAITVNGFVNTSVTDVTLRDWKSGKGRYICAPESAKGGRFCYLEMDGFQHLVALENEDFGEVFRKWTLNRSI